MTDKTEINDSEVKEYTLKAPQDHPKKQPLLICRGIEKFHGDKVKLCSALAERHKNILA